MQSRKKKTSQILKKRGKSKRKGIKARLIRWCFGLGVLLVISGGLAAAGVFLYLNQDLPKISRLADYRPSLITTVYADDERKIGEFYHERRIVIPLTEIPEKLKQAFVAAEDARFYQHPGLDLFSIIRAFIKNIEAGAIVQGGSTITQQVTKSFLLTPERSYTRKIKEAILAYRIDKSFSKDEILYLYLNQIYLGHGAYGVEAAAENYFGKTVGQLNLAECAVLAGLPQAPSKYSPFKYPEKAKQRQVYVLNRMVAEGYISNIQATEAVNQKLDVQPRRNWYIEKVPFYAEYVRQYVEKKYGPDALYHDGLKVYTAANIDMQNAARDEIEKGLEDLEKRQGYRTESKHLLPKEIQTYCEKLEKNDRKGPPEQGQPREGVIVKIVDDGGIVRMGDIQGFILPEDMKGLKRTGPDKENEEQPVRPSGSGLSVGDVVNVILKEKKENSDLWQLEVKQSPRVQSALLCIETETGYVKTMVGGRDFMESQYNRAIQSKRQPGSAFKPIIYAAALDKGYTPATMLIDSPIAFHDSQSDVTWKPKNYKDTFFGPTLFRDALAKSINVVTIKILQDIGVDYAIGYARKLGVESEIARNLSIALGSSGVSLLELVKAYSVFANQGVLIEPVFIIKILDRDGNVLEEAIPQKKQVIEKSTAYIMTSLLESVVKDGTGQRVLALNRPAAGKTGTTNDLYDAWFVGYTPQYVTGTWVGFDEERSLGQNETGGRAASPIWLEFMQKILQDKPVKIFQVPQGVVFSRIDSETGLLPISESKNIIFECFKEGTAPTESTPKPGSVSEPDDFYKTGL
jgi:penicillin-binding protein 1A